MTEQVTTFDTRLKEIPVTIDDKPYVVRELNGQGESTWRAAAGGTISVVDGKATITDIDMKDPEIRLLAICLYDTGGALVSPAVLKTWPATVLSKLYDIAQKLSGLDKDSRKKQEDDAKNSSQPTS